MAKVVSGDDVGSFVAWHSSSFANVIRTCMAILLLNIPMYALVSPTSSTLVSLLGGVLLDSYVQMVESTMCMLVGGTAHKLKGPCSELLDLADNVDIPSSVKSGGRVAIDENKVVRPRSAQKGT